MPNLYPIETTLSPSPQTTCIALKEKAFHFPFFDEGIVKAKEFNAKRHNLETIQFSEGQELLTLKGLIFHTSHCGSTLLANMLKENSTVRVVSEPEAINGLLLSKALYQLPEDRIVEQLKKIILLYQQKAGHKTDLIIKLTSWNVMLIKLFIKAFPNLKWIYLDRSQPELLNSLMKKSGGFIDWYDFPTDVFKNLFLDPNVLVKSKADYLAQMVNKHREHAMVNKNHNSLFLDYSTFIDQYNQILQHFGIEATEMELARSKEVSTYNSKSIQKEIWKSS